MRYTLAIAALVLPALSHAQNVRFEDDGLTRLVATATKTVRLTPDRATIYAVVEGSSDTGVEAAGRAERKLQAVTEAVKKFSGKAEVVSSVPYGVMPTPNYGGYPGQQSTNPFTARYVLRIQPSRVDQLMGLAAEVVAAGAVLGAPMFEAAGADSVRRSKFSEALAQARGDAEALASGLGMRLGSLIEVTTNPGPMGPQFGGNYINFGRGFDMSGPGQLPEITVMTTVTVRYRLQPR